MSTFNSTANFNNSTLKNNHEPSKGPMTSTIFGNSFISTTLALFNQTISLTTTPTTVVKLKMDWMDYFLVVCFLVIFVCGVFGNSVVCYFFKTSYKEMKGMALLLFYLALVDLLASIVNPILFLYWQLTFHRQWHFGIVGCKIIPTVAKCLVTSSLGIIWLITIERCIVISRPYTVHLKNKHIRMGFLLIILFAVLYEIPWIVHNQVMTTLTCNVPDLRVDSFFFPAVLVIIMRDLVFLVSFFITTIVVYRVLYDKSSLKTLKEQKTLQRNKKIMKVLVVLAVVFILLVFPRDLFHVAYMISWKDGEGIPHTHAIRNLNSFLKILHMCNSIANIFIYAGLFGRFRHKLMRIFSKMFGRKVASKDINSNPFSDSGLNHSSVEQTFQTYTSK